MTVSVIIPSYQGAKRLPNILEALAAQSHSDFELIVAIDGSTDDTEAVLQHYQQRLPQLRWQHWPNGGRAVIRNRGAALANGELLVFIDDDMRPVPDCLARHIAHHQQYPGSILTGAQIEDYDWVHNDLQRYKADLSRKWQQGLPPKGEAMTANNLHLTAANCSVPATLFEALGGFNEALTDAEDYELAVRALEAGISLHYDPEAIGWHDDAITCASYVRRRREYAAARSKLIAIAPALAKFLPLRSKADLSPLSRAVYSLFARKWWVQRADSGSLTVLPRPLRDRVYTWIIWGLSLYYTDRDIT